MRTHIKYILLFIFMQYISGAQIKKILPDQLRIQFAGETGFLSLGPVWSFWGGRIESGISYGYTPRSTAKVEIHSLSIKNNIIWLRKAITKNSLIKCHSGFGILLDINGNTFYQLPEQYPSNYYAPNSVNILLESGAEYKPPINCLFIKHIGVYAEICTLGNFLWYGIKDKASDFTDQFSLGLGLQFYF